MGPFETQVQKISRMQEGASMSTSQRNRINDGIHPYTTSPQSQIPLGKFDEVLRKQGFLLVNEDGTPWAGFLSGRDGRAMIDIGVLGSQDENDIHHILPNVALSLTWHKFPTGRYEVVAYVS